MNRTMCFVGLSCAHSNCTNVIMHALNSNSNRSFDKGTTFLHVAEQHMYLYSVVQCDQRDKFAAAAAAAAAATAENADKFLAV